MTKIGVIGAGKWGINHVRTFSELESELVGIADPRNEIAELAQKYGIIHENNYKDLLPKVDAVSIATPTDTHYGIVKECLLSGKHVLVEKPITLHPEEAKELASLAAQKNLILGVGHLFRFNSAVLKLNEEIKNIGDIDYITSRYIHSTNPPRTDSGTVFNFAIHLFDVLNFILKIPPKKIFCKTINHISHEREDCALISIDYGNFIASLEVSWLHPLKKRDIWVIGSKEKIYSDLLEQTMTKYFIEISQKEIKNRGSFDVDIIQNEPLKEELRHFIECIEENKTPVNSAIVGYEIVKLCDAALRSAKTGEEIVL
jgi:UDP-N-acetylglucosamine 3-dehydrogenase